MKKHESRSRKVVRRLNEYGMTPSWEENSPITYLPLRNNFKNIRYQEEKDEDGAYVTYPLKSNLTGGGGRHHLSPRYHQVNGNYAVSAYVSSVSSSRK